MNEYQEAMRRRVNQYMDEYFELEPHNGTIDGLIEHIQVEEELENEQLGDPNLEARQELERDLVR